MKTSAKVFSVVALLCLAGLSYIALSPHRNDKDDVEKLMQALTLPPQQTETKGGQFKQPATVKVRLPVSNQILYIAKLSENTVTLFFDRPVTNSMGFIAKTIRQHGVQKITSVDIASKAFCITFDLHVTTIEKVTAAILDYVDDPTYFSFIRKNGKTT